MDLFNNITFTDFLSHAFYNLPYVYVFYIYYDVGIRNVKNQYNQNFINIVEKIQEIDGQINDINNNIKILFELNNTDNIKNENIITEMQLLRHSSDENSKNIENMSKTIKKIIEQ